MLKINVCMHHTVQTVDYLAITCKKNGWLKMKAGLHTQIGYKINCE